jgi:hypothetical protein
MCVAVKMMITSANERIGCSPLALWPLWRLVEGLELAARVTEENLDRSEGSCGSITVLSADW